MIGLIRICSLILENRSIFNISEKVWINIIIFQSFQVLEIVHCYINIVPSDIVATSGQVISRINIIICSYFYPEILVHPISTIMILVWTLSEVNRYSYFLFSAYGFKIDIMRKVRYSVPILLYPLGWLVEVPMAIIFLPITHSDPRITEYDYFLLLFGIFMYTIGFIHNFRYLLQQRSRSTRSIQFKESKY